MKKIIFSLLLGFGTLNSAMAVEGDADAGKIKSASCGSCHGATGVNPSPTFPNLAGQNIAYVVKQLKDFKSGARKDAMMSPMVASLSEQDMADLATYFNMQKRGGDDASAASSAAPSASNVELVLSSPAAAIYGGDIKAGHEKSAVCASCHGADGNSMVAMYPKLAGQSAMYIAKQLADFKSGARVDALMAPMVAGLSTTDINDIAAFFAVQSASAGTVEPSELGRKIYFGGDSKKAVTACIACHGVNGKGMAQAGFPTIAGQNSDYLVKQLNAFRSGERKNDRNSIMGNIAINLSDSDIKELAQYMASLK